MRRWLLALGLLAAGVVQAQTEAVPAPTPTAAPPSAPAAVPATLRTALARGLPAPVYFLPAAIRSAQLSPDGRHLAVTTSLGSPRVSLVVIDLGPGGTMVRAAQVAEADITSVHWVNNRRLVFGAAEFAGGRARSGPGLYAVNIDGSESRQLIQRISYSITDGNTTSRTLSAMHSLLRVPRPRDGRNEVLVGEWSGDSSYILGTSWLNIDNGRKRRSEHGLPNGSFKLLTDSEGEPRVAITRTGKALAAWWRGPGQADWTRIAEGDTLNGLPFEPHTVDDSGTLYVTQRSGKAGELELTRFDFASGAPEAKAVISSPGFDFSGSLEIAPESGEALGLRVLTDGEQAIWFDAARKRLQALADARFPSSANRISCRRCGQADELMLVHVRSDKDPGALWLYRAQPGDKQLPWQLLMRANPVMRNTPQASVVFERIQARDGRDLPVWLTLPPGADKGKPRPAVVLVHGGPWVRGGSWSWQPMQQFLASRGFLVIEPEFRGSTGYGLAHFKAGWKQWGQAMQDDVADALLWAQKQGLASDKACIAGASYGGYSTLMGLIKHPELYRCGIAWVAVTDLELLVKGSWWVDDDSDLARKHTIPDMVGDGDKDADMLIANSPVRQAARIKAPLLLAMGEVDQRVPLAHGKRLREAMEAAGNPPEWVVYPGEGHGWSRLDHRADFANRVDAFLARHLPR